MPKKNNYSNSALITRNSPIFSITKNIINSISNKINDYFEELNQNDLKAIQERQKYEHLFLEDSLNMQTLNVEITTKQLSQGGTALHSASGALHIHQALSMRTSPSSF